MFKNSPGSFEIERKFLVEYPLGTDLESFEDYKRFDIEQTYLKATAGFERRVRKRCDGEITVYFETVKKNADGIKRIELEKNIDKDKYFELLALADKTKHPIYKTRHCFSYSGKLFELDVYTFWENCAIVEIELESEDCEIIFPPGIKIIKEVTNDPCYKNSSLAKLKPSR